MITLEARIEVNGVPDVKIKEAVSNIPDTVGNYNIFAGMVVTAGTFIGSQYSNSEGNFVERYDAAEKTMWFEAQRMTFSPSGRVIYNDIPCFYFEVAYETNLSGIIRYVSYANVNQLIVTPVEGTFCEAETNFNFEESIGTIVRLYIPVELAESSGKEAFEFMPRVRMNVTFGRESGEKGKAYEITIITDNPTENLSVSFGKGTNQYPYSVIVDGTERSVKSKDFEVSGLLYSTRHTIVIENWRKPSANLLISSISTKKAEEIVIDKKNILSLDSSVMSLADIEQPSFGLISNGGQLSFSDKNNLALKFANDGLLIEGLNVNVIIRNSITSNEKTIGTYYTKKWKYDVNNRSVSVDFGDVLEKLQDIEYDGFNQESYEYNNNILENKTSMWKLFLEIKGLIEQSGITFTEETNEYLKGELNKVYIMFPFMEKGSLWQQLEKFCVILRCNMYIDENGEICAKKW